MSDGAQVASLENLYRMLCYAWRRTDASTLHAGQAARFDRIEDLFGFLLARATKDILRRGVARGYSELTEDRRSPKGKLLPAETMKRQLRLRGRAACAFDDWDTNIPANRILKGALSQLATALSPSSPAAACELRSLERHFSDVVSLPLAPSSFQTLAITPGQRHYAFALDICALLASSSLPAVEGAGRRKFVDPRTDEQTMGWIFENFVRHYLEMHLDAEYRVLPERRLNWALQTDSPAAQSLVPRMETDIRISGPTGLSIIEVKCTHDPLQSGRDGKRRLRPAHLYQLHAYVSHLAEAGLEVRRAVLLLGSPTSAFTHHYRMGTVDWVVTAVDLRDPWDVITAGIAAVAGGGTHLARAG